MSDKKEVKNNTRRQDRIVRKATKVISKLIGWMGGREVNPAEAKKLLKNIIEKL